jgi:hypothetical protein
MKLHLTLKRYRVVSIAITLFFLWLGYDAWEWYKVNQATMSEASSASFAAIFLSIIGALKYVLENLNKGCEHD